MKQVRYVVNWFRDPARSRHKIVRPRQLNFPVTDTCNSRCVMCDVWKENAVDDMSLAELRMVLAQPFFQELEHVGISGGEPFLRKDLADVVELFCQLPRIKSISITSHGFNERRHRLMGPKIVELARRYGVPFTINLSIDGVSDVHDRVRRVPGGFAKLERTIALYRALGTRVVGQCTVSKVNLYNLPDLDHYARANGIDMIYRASTTIERLYNKDAMNDVELDARERSFFADFLVNSGVIERTANPGRRLFYRQLVQMLQAGAPRRAPCYYQNEAVLLNANGEVFQCSIVESAVGCAKTTAMDDRYFSDENIARLALTKLEICSTCPHDQTGAWPPHRLLGEQLRNTKLGRAISKLPDLAGKAYVTLCALALPLKRVPLPLATVAEKGATRTAAIIGCYGGEHVGDAAILGGVLLRLHREHQVTHARVLSSRVDRTAGWAGQLRTPVSVVVEPYDLPTVRDAVSKSDLLVIGGGPIMDLPALLAQHIQAARIAARHTVPLVAEGVGFGPFRRNISAKLAQRLLGATARASFRTKRSFDAAHEFANVPIQTFDPAFTYLTEVNLSKPATPDYVASLRKAGRPLIGLNLRPLWARYATAEFDDAGVRAIELRCLAVVSDVIRRRTDCDFVFLPFNSDQLGMSDLNIAFQLRRDYAVGDNFHIWESEPTIDQMIGALRACDGLIAMRFHACIFGISVQSCPVLGIDYGIGKSSKVAELFDDNPQAGTYASVASVEASEIETFIDCAGKFGVRRVLVEEAN